MLSFLVRRIVAIVPVLFVVALIVFMMTRFAPGDPAAAIVGNDASAANLERVRSNLGLNDPLPVQFGRWGWQLLQGSLGESFFLKKPVSELIGQRVEPTFALTVMTLVMTVLIAVPLGVIAAWRHGGWLDRMLMGLSALGFSVPAFVIGYVLIWMFALRWQLLPVQGYGRISDGIGPWLSHLILPATTLSIIYVALIARVTRAAVAEAMTEDYIRTARAKGISETRVLVRHALANAAVPIVTVIGIGVALLIGGVVVTEFGIRNSGIGLAYGRRGAIAGFSPDPGNHAVLFRRLRSRQSRGRHQLSGARSTYSLLSAGAINGECWLAFLRVGCRALGTQTPTLAVASRDLQLVGSTWRGCALCADRGRLVGPVARNHRPHRDGSWQWQSAAGSAR